MAAPKFQTFRDLRKYLRPPTCAVCNRRVYGKGWFCSYECDEAERLSRLADELAEGLRALGETLLAAARRAA